MDCSRKYQKTSSSCLATKSIVAALFLVLGACSSSSKKYDFKSAQKDSRENELFQITSLGQNYQGSYSPDGTKILFVSEGRESHKQGQIYELDLFSKLERRVTYNAGSDQNPIYHPKDDVFLYSSTTDAIKENIPVDQLMSGLGVSEREPQSHTTSLQPHEIYISLLHGTRIRRLTHNNFYDGDAHFTPEGNKIVFSSFENSAFRLKSLNVLRNAEESLSLSFKNIRWPSIKQFDNLRLLLGVQTDSLQTKLVVQQIPQKQVLYETTDAFNYQQPSWHPTDKKFVYSSNSGDNFDIYVYDIAKTCRQQITFAKSSDQDPQFSPDGRTILFTSNRSGLNQLYFIKYSDNQTCETIQAQL